MEITKEMLDTIFTRANQYAITRYGKQPDALKLEYDGTISAEWTNYYCGEADTTSECITAENLTEDLDAVAAQRLKQEEEERIKRQAYQAEQKRLREEQEKNRRRQQYLDLKKEFENI